MYSILQYKEYLCSVDVDIYWFQFQILVYNARRAYQKPYT